MPFLFEEKLYLNYFKIKENIKYLNMYKLYIYFGYFLISHCAIKFNL